MKTKQAVRIKQQTVIAKDLKPKKNLKGGFDVFNMTYKMGGSMLPKLSSTTAMGVKL